MSRRNNNAVGKTQRMIWLIILAMTFSVVPAFAQNRSIQGDPFFPSDGGAAAAMPSQEEWGRDPFDNPFAGGTAERTGTGRRRPVRTNNRNLTGIIYSAGASIVIIGGDTFREGETVGNMKIEKILRNSVVLRNTSGGREEIFLEKYSGK
jgi:hypothetical protein